MIDGIIFLVVMIVATELFYYKVALKYDFFCMSDGEVKVKKKTMKGYRLGEACTYKFLSLTIGFIIAFIIKEVIKNWDNKYIIEIGIVAALVAGVVIFFWINWMFTKKRQGGQVPEKKEVPQW